MQGQIKSALMNMSLREEDFERKSEYEKDFKFNRKFKDPRFGEISVIQDVRSKQFLAVKEKHINDKKEANKAIVNARKRMSNKHPNILNLLDYSIHKQSELCSTLYIIKFFYEFPKSDLHRELQLKHKAGEDFNDIELTHILYQQISANKYLQTKDQHHGNIQPLNIAYDKVNYLSKLIDTSEDATTINDSKSLQMERIFNDQPLYQSPISYSELIKNNLNYEYDPNKEDVYALALVIMELGNGQSFQNIYSYADKKINEKALQTHIDEFKRKFSLNNTLLTTTIESMLAKDESKRPSFMNLEEKLPPYEVVSQHLVNRQINQSLNVPQGSQLHVRNINTYQSPNVYGQQKDWDFSSYSNNYNYAQKSQTEKIEPQNLPRHIYSTKSSQEISSYPYRHDSNIQYGTPTRTEHIPNQAQIKTQGFKSEYYQNYPSAEQRTDKTLSTQQNVLQSTAQPFSYRSNYQNVPTYYSGSNINYSTYSILSEPRKEIRTLKPVYRREYITTSGKRYIQLNNEWIEACWYNSKNSSQSSFTQTNPNLQADQYLGAATQKYTTNIPQAQSQSHQFKTPTSQPQTYPAFKIKVQDYNYRVYQPETQYYKYQNLQHQPNVPQNAQTYDDSSSQKFIQNNSQYSKDENTNKENNKTIEQKADSDKYNVDGSAISQNDKDVIDSKEMEGRKLNEFEPDVEKNYSTKNDDNNQSALVK